MQVVANLCRDRRRRWVLQQTDIRHFDSVDGNPQLAEAAVLAVNVQISVLSKLRRHPGGDERLTGSDRTMMDFDSAHPILPTQG